MEKKLKDVKIDATIHKDVKRQALEKDKTLREEMESLLLKGLKDAGDKTD